MKSVVRGGDRTRFTDRVTDRVADRIADRTRFTHRVRVFLGLKLPPLVGPGSGLWGARVRLGGKFRDTVNVKIRVRVGIKIRLRVTGRVKVRVRIASVRPQRGAG